MGRALDNAMLNVGQKDSAASKTLLPLVLAAMLMSLERQ
jgi:hypothetical protein